jgi:hypothetical protein
MTGQPHRPRCPRCKVRGVEPMRFAGRLTWRIDHRDGCPIGRVLAHATAPRTEADYLAEPGRYEPGDFPTPRGRK